MMAAPGEDDPQEDIAERRMRFVFALRSKGVTDGRVLAAMERIDRGAFLRGIFAERAYEDTPLPIACGQTISQPSVVGLMTQALELEPRHKVLEVGTGSGYQAAILACLARRIYTTDRHRRLVRDAEAVFAALGLSNITASSPCSSAFCASSSTARVCVSRSGRGGEARMSPHWPMTWSARARRSASVAAASRP